MKQDTKKYNNSEGAAPLVADIRDKHREAYRSPIKLLLIIVGSIFVAELAIMLFIYAFPKMSWAMESPLTNTIFDATLLVIILSPILYYFLFRPLIRLVNDLESAITKIETLSGLIPICSYCKKIRDDKGYWNKIETYISSHSKAEFTHGICPECGKKAIEEFNHHSPPPGG